MKKFIACTMATLLCAAPIFSQGKNVDEARTIGAEARALIQQEIRDAKRRSPAGPALNVPVPADFNDVDSFGKEVKFLGSLYAGTVFVEPVCPPPFPPPFVFAPDDKCAVKPANGNLSSTVFTDPAWELVIPGKSVKNVIYLIINNSVVYDNNASGTLLGGSGIMSYSATLTIENEALNSPLAIVNGQPLNGVFTSGLPGTKFRSRTYSATEFEQEVDSYASAMGRGISKAFWRDVGLPESVIENFYKKDTKLKFGIRVAQFGAVASGQYFYTFRAFGQ